jgi:hypothetical protein
MKSDGTEGPYERTMGTYVNKPIGASYTKVGRYYPPYLQNTEHAVDIILTSIRKLDEKITKLSEEIAELKGLK